MANAVIRALDILDEHVRISEEANVAYVASQTNFPTIWVVTSPKSNWTHCNCPLSMQGNMCKHAVKAFTMINKDVSGSDIIRYACTLRGTIAGGYDIGGLGAFKGSHTSEAYRPT